MWLIKNYWRFTPSKKFTFFVWMYEMVDINKKTYENNDIEVIVDGTDTLWLNQKHVDEKLGH